MFSANASDMDGQVVSYSWDFDGDGQQDASGPSPTYEFDRLGSYSATLTVTDNDGATGRASRSVSVAQRYDTATITRVTVVDMPFVDGSGAGWDFGSGPDVYIDVYRDQSFVRTSAVYYEDVAPSSLPLDFDEADFTVSDLSERYAIFLFDYDPTNDDDYIGGIGFDLTRQIGTYPSTVRLDAGGGIKYDLSLDWGLSSARVDEAYAAPEVGMSEALLLVPPSRSEPSVQRSAAE